MKIIVIFLPNAWDCIKLGHRVSIGSCSLWKLSKRQHHGSGIGGGRNCFGHLCVSRSSNVREWDDFHSGNRIAQNEIFVIRNLRLFFIYLDRFIWNFMIVWMGPFFVGVGNLFGMVALLELRKSTCPSADKSLSIVRTLMITLWFCIEFCYWYLSKYYHDDYNDGKF